MIETPAMELALLADQVLPMEAIALSQIREAAETVRGIPAEYMRGITQRESGEPLIILQVQALLASKQLIVHEEIL